MSTEPGPATLPDAPILSYLTNLNSMTRVRKVAAIGLRIMAAFHLVVAVSLSVLCVPEFLEVFRFSTMPLLNTIVELAPDIFLLLVAFYCLGIGGIQFALAGAVYRGARGPCRISRASLVGSVFGCALSAALVGGYSCLYGFSIGRYPGDPHELLWLLVSLAFTIATLLILDLMRLLHWIARTPSAEKPPLRFLSVSASLNP